MYWPRNRHKNRLSRSGKQPLQCSPRILAMNSLKCSRTLRKRCARRCTRQLCDSCAMHKERMQCFWSRGGTLTLITRARLFCSVRLIMWAGMVRLLTSVSTAGHWSPSQITRVARRTRFGCLPRGGQWWREKSLPHSLSCGVRHTRSSCILRTQQWSIVPATAERRPCSQICLRTGRVLKMAAMARGRLWQCSSMEGGLTSGFQLHVPSTRFRSLLGREWEAVKFPPAGIATQSRCHF